MWKVTMKRNCVQSTGKWRNHKYSIGEVTLARSYRQVGVGERGYAGIKIE